MASIFRLSNAMARKVLFSPTMNAQSQMNNIRAITLKPKPYVPVNELSDFDAYNMNKKRPQSPHLSIYAVQLTSVLSLTHRACGIGLAFYTMTLGLGALASPVQLSVLLDSVEVPWLLVPLVKLAIAFPISYHFFNGIRHLSWDFGKFLSIKEVYSTGYVMAAFSIIGTVILMLL